MVTSDNQNKRVLQYESFSYCDIFHFVTTRNGGVSRGSYASFNLSPYTGDDAEDVAKNRRLLGEELCGELVLPVQTHDDVVMTLDASWETLCAEEKQQRLQGVDALVTSLKGVCIGVSTADCVPVLLYDPVRKVAGAAHAGWRGTTKHIVSKTVASMVALGGDAKDIRAAIGPSISQKHFEVGDEVVAAFEQAGFEVSELVVRNSRTGKAHIDLWKANEMDLTDSGIDAAHIEIAGICSVERHEDFFSARTLGIRSGRTVSGIMIRR